MKSEEISLFLADRIEVNDFPSAVYLVAEKGEIKFADALGLAVKSPHNISAERETIYDLASLTKPLVTGLLCAKLIEANEIKLEDKVSQYLPQFERPEKREITVQNLIAHTSGFVAWQPFYLLTEEPSKVLSLIADFDLDYEPNTKVKYSDFNFLTLGFLLEKLHGKKLEKIAQTEIFDRLRLRSTFFNPPKEEQNEIDACEFGNEYEKQVCQEMGFDVAKENNRHFTFRNRLIWGEVHDRNCWFLGGVSGHAGLFSSASDVFKIAGQFLANFTTLLKPETCELFRTNFTQKLNEARSFAFELAATPDSTAGTSLSSNSFGHLGFTGTSIWIEPETERVFVLLTNRTHHSLPFININATRRKFHELASETLNAVKSDNVKDRKRG
jgi:CubicO group peptidase (beta-lactamase class C family)